MQCRYCSGSSHTFLHYYRQNAEWKKIIMLRVYEIVACMSEHWISINMIIIIIDIFNFIVLSGRTRTRTIIYLFVDLSMVIVFRKLKFCCTNWSEDHFMWFRLLIDIIFSSILNCIKIYLYTLSCCDLWPKYDCTENRQHIRYPYIACQTIPIF